MIAPEVITALSIYPRSASVVAGLGECQNWSRVRSPSLLVFDGDLLLMKRGMHHGPLGSASRFDVKKKNLPLALRRRHLAMSTNLSHHSKSTKVSH